MRNIIVSLFILLGLFSCQKDSIKVEQEIEIENSDTIINLTHGFKIGAGKREDFGSFRTYSLLKLMLDNIEVVSFEDSLEFEFAKGFHNYPTVREISGEAKYEVALELNDRPNKNYLLVLTVKNGLVTASRKAPTFEIRPKNLDNDNELEVFGLWDDSQVWGKSDELLVAYNPLIFYEMKKEGLMIDSTLTEKYNSSIYGKFMGYQFSEDIVVVFETLDKLEKEIELIKNQ